MEIFLAYVLLHNAFIIVAEKYNIKGRLQWISEKLRAKVIYQLAECEFCTKHLVGLLFLIPFSLIRGAEWLHLLYPVMSTSLLFLITKPREK